jgi:hypothetical protein
LFLFQLDKQLTFNENNFPGGRGNILAHNIRTLEIKEFLKKSLTAKACEPD